MILDGKHLTERERFLLHIALEKEAAYDSIPLPPLQSNEEIEEEEKESNGSVPQTDGRVTRERSQAELVSR